MGQISRTGKRKNDNGFVKRDTFYYLWDQLIGQNPNGNEFLNEGIHKSSGDIETCLRDPKDIFRFCLSIIPDNLKNKNPAFRSGVKLVLLSIRFILGGSFSSLQ